MLCGSLKLLIMNDLSMKIRWLMGLRGKVLIEVIEVAFRFRCGDNLILRDIEQKSIVCAGCVIRKRRRGGEFAPDGT
jgi:hypothetical protein